MSMFVWASAEYAPERDEARMAGRMKLAGALQEEPGNLGSRIGETGKETTRRGARRFMTILCSRRGGRGRGGLVLGASQRRSNVLGYS
jgi:hypothetical protein